MKRLISLFSKKDVMIFARKLRFILFHILILLFLIGIFFRLFPDRLATIKERSLSFSEDWRDFSLPFTMSPIRLYAFPDHTCSIDAYGAKADGTTLNTVAIAQAIADCSAQGGGTVRIPPGKFLTGAIHLASGIRLDISEGAELLFSQNVEDYLPTVFSRYEGMEYYGYSPLIYANDCHDIAITGKGSIDGQGQSWWIWKGWQQKGAKKLYALSSSGVPVPERVFGTEEDGLRPALMEFVHCERVEVSGVTLKDGPMWTLHPLYSEDILIRDITVETSGPNTDGIVLDSSKNVLIDHVRIDAGDDAIALKSGVDQDGKRVGRPTENVVITDCSIGRGNGGVVIGSETSGDIRNVFVSRCTFDGTKRGIRVKSAPGRGGIVENIRVEDTTMRHIAAEALFLNMFYDSKNVVRPSSTDAPIFRHFSFKNITVLSANDGFIAIGATDSPISDLRFENVALTTTRGLQIENVDTLDMAGLALHAFYQPNITLQNVAHAVFADSRSTKKPSVTVLGHQSQDIRFADTFPLSSLRIGKEVSSRTVIRESEK